MKGKEARKNYQWGKTIKEKKLERGNSGETTKKKNGKGANGGE